MVLNRFFKIMGHLLKMALMGTGGSPGAINTFISKIPSNTLGTLNVTKNGVNVISIVGGTSSVILMEGDTFSATASSNISAYRELYVNSNIRGNLFSGTRDAGVPGVISSGTFTALDEEIISIDAYYIV